MKIERVDHIGIAVTSLDQGLTLYRDALGLPLEATEDLPDRGLKVAMLEAHGTHIELLESVREDSTIAKFIARRGPGIHHIALRVDDIDAALVDLRNRGVRLVDEVARPGAGGTRVAFVHPAAAGGVLLELVEPPRPA